MIIYHDIIFALNLNIHALLSKLFKTGIYWNFMNCINDILFYFFCFLKWDWQSGIRNGRSQCLGEPTKEEY